MEDSVDKNFEDVEETVVSDMDYPPVGGFRQAVDYAKKHRASQVEQSKDDRSVEPKVASAEASEPSILSESSASVEKTIETNQASPKQPLVSDSQVFTILSESGLEVDAGQVNALNFFPSPIGAFTYALFTFGIADHYIVLMVNSRNRSIYGYHILDLTQEYSLEEDLVTQMRAQAFLN